MFGSKQKRLNRQLLKAAEKGDAAGVEAALQAGADIEARIGGASAITALGHAVIAQSLDAVEALIRRGADLEATDRHGDTPLCYALQMKNPAIAEQLLAAGAETRVRGWRGRTPLSLAQEMGDPVLQQKILEAQTPKAAPNPDEVTYERPFGNRILEETFNFAARERISLIRLVSKGPVEAITRDSFAAIGDREQLARAYVDYKTAGGRLDVPDIFGGER